MNDEKSTPKKGKWWKRILLSLLSLSILAAMFQGVFAYYRLERELYTNDAQVQEYINPVNTRVTGYIKEVRFTDHQRCRKGDTLVVIDDREFVINLEHAKAAWMSARASRNVTASAVSTVGSNISITDANIRSLDASIWNSQRNMERYEHLLAEGAATQQQYDQVRSEYVSLAEKKEALVQQRMTTGLSTTQTSRQIPVNDAQIRQAKAAMDLAALNLSYTVITAPYDGATGRRTIQEGQAVSAGQTLLSFVRSDSIWVVANYKETQVSRLHIGGKMILMVDGIPDQKFEGRVVAISKATGSLYSAIPVDNSTGNFVKVRQRIPVRIEFTDKNLKSDLERLIAGMNVEALTTEK